MVVTNATRDSETTGTDNGHDVGQRTKDARSSCRRRKRTLAQHQQGDQRRRDPPSGRHTTHRAQRERGASTSSARQQRQQEAHEERAQAARQWQRQKEGRENVGSSGLAPNGGPNTSFSSLAIYHTS